MSKYPTGSMSETRWRDNSDTVLRRDQGQRVTNAFEAIAKALATMSGDENDALVRPYVHWNAPSLTTYRFARLKPPINAQQCIDPRIARHVNA
jgi:hypothetical protein